MDINYTHDNIAKAIRHLVTAEESMPQRAWDAYARFATRCSARDGLETEFDALDKIFKDIRHDEVSTKLTLEDAMRGSEILLGMFEQTCQ